MVDKKIGKFRVHFDSDYNKDDDDSISLKITIDDELRALIKSVCVVDEDLIIVSRRMDSEIEQEFKRYKVKSPIINSMYSDYKEIVFIKDLVDNGCLIIKFSEYDNRDRIMRNMRDLFRVLLETMDRTRVSETVTYNMRSKEDNE